MKSKLLAGFILGVGLLAVCGSVFAHHGNTAYEDKVVELKQATVTKFAVVQSSQPDFFRCKR